MRHPIQPTGRRVPAGPARGVRGLPAAAEAFTNFYNGLTAVGVELDGEMTRLSALLGNANFGDIAAIPGFSEPVSSLLHLASAVAVLVCGPILLRRCGGDRRL